MPLYEQSKTIWGAAPKRGICRRCGDEYPLELGDTAETCSEWAQLTASRLQKPIPVAVLLDLASWVRHCDLIYWLKRQLAGLEHGLELD
jgi:hypothetical protein